MPIVQGENEFSGFPRDQVVDWLGHPVTEFVKQQLGYGIAECNLLAVNVCDASTRISDAAIVKSDAMSVAAARKAYLQVQALFDTAESYVATKEESHG